VVEIVIEEISVLTEFIVIPTFYKVWNFFP